jgi:hypothetical protein
LARYLVFRSRKEANRAGKLRELGNVPRVRDAMRIKRWSIS